MARNKIQILIQKIQSIVGEDDSISRLEKDLVKDYLRELYEYVEAIPVSGSLREPTSSQSQPLESPIKEHRASAIPKVIDRDEEPLTRVEEPKEKEVIESFFRREPIIPNGKKEPRNWESANEKEEKPAPSTIIEEPAPIPEVFRQEIPTPKKYDILFENGQAKELSDKLSRLPISDLNRAFSINDRLLIVADLFGNDQLKFQETIDILNSKYSFEEAKSYLIRYIVETYQWLDEEKTERAKEFIKLVERRYLGR
ncbi:MAG: hypothetical protein KDC53_13770 [Saprospiraceae bacterium]|nr:hypothetical protein [Saprospiraceae bacterium]